MVQRYFLKLGTGPENLFRLESQLVRSSSPKKLFRTKVARSREAYTTRLHSERCAQQLANNFYIESWAENPSPDTCSSLLHKMCVQLSLLGKRVRASSLCKFLMKLREWSRRKCSLKVSTRKFSAPVSPCSCFNSAQALNARLPRIAQKFA